MEKYDVVVIGGGASGIVAAFAAAMGGARTLLIEKNKRLGQKLRITGGGRCNITNAETDLRALLKNYGEAEKFLYSAFTRYGVKETMIFFESIGLPLKTEDRNRVFPRSNKAADVVHVLINQLDTYGVEVQKDTSVIGFKTEKSRITSVECLNGSIVNANQIILATGGMSRPETGSTGDGFSWLKNLGLSVREPSPTITPLSVKDSWNVLVAGAVLKNIKITFRGEKDTLKISGDILVTHFGLSGPLILNNAYKVADMLLEGEVVATVDLFPDEDMNTFDSRIAQLLQRSGAKQIKNVISEVIPPSMHAALELVIDSDILRLKAAELSKVKRVGITRQLKSFPLEITGLMGFERAVVADGGVDLRELDMRTFRSKKINNLFITGDLLDIRRPSGGYSLQLCWTSGFIAGKEAAQSSIIMKALAHQKSSVN
jgi:predicted Rossmann fold flavoprotein